jgi:hypothetical protein
MTIMDEEDLLRIVLGPRPVPLDAETVDFQVAMQRLNKRLRHRAAEERLR